jgi:hypothetical protein
VNGLLGPGQLGHVGHFNTKGKPAAAKVTRSQQAATA